MPAVIIFLSGMRSLPIQTKVLLQVDNPGSRNRVCVACHIIHQEDTVAHAVAR
jgi:Zn-finger protein